MTDEAKRSHEWLLSLASGKGFASYLIGAPEAAKQAADMIDELSRKVKEYETQIAGLEIMLTTAQSAAETWKHRAEAAINDIPTCCALCKYETEEECTNPNECCNISGINTGWEWRGPCAENGGES